MPMQNTRTVSGRAALIAFIVAVVLQLMLAPQISLLGGAINFMVVVAVVLALVVEPSRAVWIGFLCGLFFDLTSSVPVGLMALLLTIAAHLVSSASQGLSPGVNVESMRLVCLAILGVNLVDGFALYLIGSESSLIYALGVHALVSSVLDILVSIPFLAALGSTAQTRGFSARGTSPTTYATPTSRSGRKGSKKRRTRSGRSGGSRYKL